MNGVELIAQERQRQIEQEGWTTEHDDNNHQAGELARAAACYAVDKPIWFGPFGTAETEKDLDSRRLSFRLIHGLSAWFDTVWPWHEKRKKHNRIRRLVIAGALIAAEIDRLQRQQDQ
jgi:hypothetical protein